MPNQYLVSAFILVAVVSLIFWEANNAAAPTTAGTVCTLEAKLCPDGSYVGRTGPNCEFAACPAATTTSTSGTGSSGGILPYTSGIQGTISLGPTCPVERMPPEPACADKPYATTVRVYHAGISAVFATAESNAAGIFKISLPPGSYTLTAGSGSMLPRCASVSAEVGPSGYAIVHVSCDTGIR